ncbi:MAG TPA: AI-2E family transporter [Chitinophagaceae bacterium]|nr:AI-2E family transporter [Chitinophagaceae bacterium]
MEPQQHIKIKQYFFLAIIFAFAYFLLTALWQFFSAFLIAIIFYILSDPLVAWLVKKRRWRKSWAAVLVIILSFFIILLPITILFTLLYDRVSSVLAQPDSIVEGLKKFNDSIEAKYHYELISDKTIDTIKSNIAALLPVILDKGVGFISTIAMMYFFLYFMLQQRGRMEAAIVFYLPFKRDKIKLFSKELVAQTFSNAVGIPMIAVAQGLFAFISYLIVGVNQPGFWGVITAFTSILPVVGSAVVWLPMSIYLFATGQNWQGVFVLVWSAAVVGSVDNVLRFMLAKRMADVHPIVTVLGVIIGLRYFGFIGLIFGPVLISYFLILLKIYYFEYQKGQAPADIAAAPPRKKQQPKKRQLMPPYIQPLLGKTPAKKNQSS